MLSPTASIIPHGSSGRAEGSEREMRSMMKSTAFFNGRFLRQPETGVQRSSGGITTAIVAGRTDEASYRVLGERNIDQGKNGLAVGVTLVMVGSYPNRCFEFTNTASIRKTTY
jgi:hypothetical protein